jgi:hypothetical protein
MYWSILTQLQSWFNALSLRIDSLFHNSIENIISHRKRIFNYLLFNNLESI